MLFTVADGAVIAIVSEVYRGRSVDARVGLRALDGRVGSLIGASILRSIVIFLGLILLIVPGLFMIVATFAVPMAIVVEGHPVGASFTRARQLAETNFWHVARTLALLCVVVFALFIGLSVVLGILIAVFGTAGERFLDPILNVGLIVLYPLFSVGGTLLYYDLRIRTEGLDLEMMLETLDPQSKREDTVAPLPLPDV
jgi:hypothetical protein